MVLNIEYKINEDILINTIITGHIVEKKIYKYWLKLKNKYSEFMGFVGIATKQKCFPIIFDNFYKDLEWFEKTTKNNIDILNAREKKYTNLQNKLWKKNQLMYVFLKFCNEQKVNYKIILDEYKNVYNEIKNSNIYKLVFDEAKKYKKEFEKKWKKQQTNIIKLMYELTQIKLDGKFIVYLTPNKYLRHGMNIGNRTIIYGAPERWQNYDIVYITHEMFHSYFEPNPISHAIQELLTDNYLRMYLNKSGGYFIENERDIGHPYLKEIAIKILPYWFEYLNSKNKNIMKFIKEMEIKFKNK